ncbi:MAG: hypothetical protein RL518_1863 [Pseudomonadota bacterium]
MKQLAEYSSEGLALVSRNDWTILSCNHSFHEFTGGRGEGGRPRLSDCLPPEIMSALSEHFAGRSDAWIQEHTLRFSTGRPFPARIAVEVSEDQDKDRILVLRISDISEIKKKDLLTHSVADMLNSNKKRIEEAKRNFKSMLDLLPQGFLQFDPQGIINRDHSIEAEKIFKEPVAGRHIAEVLGLSAEEAELVALVFEGPSAKMCLDALPHELQRGDRTLEVAYTPIVQDEKIVGVMTAVHDVTESRALRKALDEKTRIAKTLHAVLSAKTEFIEMIDFIDLIESSLRDPMAVRRGVHTLKGGFSFLECHDLAKVCHRWESDWRAGEYTEASGREFVSAIRSELDAFLKKHNGILRIRKGKVGYEIILEGDRLVELYRLIRSSPIQEKSKSDILESLEALMSPKLEETLGWLQMAWEDSLAKTAKPTSQISWDAAVPVFPMPYRDLFKAFVHIVRNAAAHGIESPEQRASAGKPRAGHLTISASVSNDMYRICFTDDGRGIEPSKIIEFARKRGVTVAPDMSAHEAMQLIFEPDVSSKEEADDLAGRGLGLHIVRHEANLLNGSAEVTSQPGKGTTVTITFPKYLMCNL